MPFFIRNKQPKSINKGKEKKRKLSQSEKNVKTAKSEKTNGMNEIISSDDDDYASDKGKGVTSSSEEETEQEKKLRLTKKYLAEIEKEENEKQQFSNEAKRAVAHRLQEEALEEAGRLQKKRAFEYEGKTAQVLYTLKGHKHCITCIAISSCEQFIYSGSKDCSVIKWSVETGRKIKSIPRLKKDDTEKAGHSAHVLAIALSSDDKFLATGCQNKIINIWNPTTMELLKTFRKHRGAIYGLTFIKGSHQLVSASADRLLNLWNLDEMGYIQTLTGHANAITCIDSFLGESFVTSGGRDNTVHIWKLLEKSAARFQGHGPSIDCVCVSSPHHFITGAEDGTLSLWGMNKKKPLFKLLKAHGCHPENEEPNWITSLCALRNTDLIASGSQDGNIRLWKRDDEQRSILPVSTVPVVGFVNALCFSLSGKYLVAGLGQEHKLGRWWRIKEAKNVVVIYTWPNTT